MILLRIGRNDALSLPTLRGTYHGGNITVGVREAGCCGGTVRSRRGSRRLKVFVVRKIGLPGQSEFGVGAIAEGGEPLLENAVLSQLGVSANTLSATIVRERPELSRRLGGYPAVAEFPDLVAAVSYWSTTGWRMASPLWSAWTGTEPLH
jgi:hypothetical protein